MAHKGSSFTALPDAVIQIHSMTDLKRYLLAVRPTQRGLPVDRYVTVGSEVRARLRYPDGSTGWCRVGPLEELAAAVQHGDLEVHAR